MSLPLILFITNQPATGDRLARDLREGGIDFNSHQAAFSEQAPALAAFHPALVVVARGQADLSEIRTLAMLCSGDPGTPFVVCPESVDADTAKRCIEIGAWDCVVQSDLPRVLSSIRTAMAFSRLRSQFLSQKASQPTRFHALAEVVPLLVWEWEARGRVLFGNRLWAKTVGAANRETNDWFQLIHPEDRERLRRELAEGCTAGAICSGEFRLRRSQEDYRVMLVYASGGPGNDPTAAGGIACAMDLAEKKAPGGWPGLPPEIRHELNNHLAIIRMLAEVFVLTPGLPTPCGTKAHEVVAAAERAIQLVRRISQPGPPFS